MPLQLLVSARKTLRVDKPRKGGTNKNVIKYKHYTMYKRDSKEACGCVTGINSPDLNDILKVDCEETDQDDCPNCNKEEIEPVWG